MIITDGFTSGYIAAKKNRRIKLNHGNQTTKKYQPANIYIDIYIYIYIKYCIIQCIYNKYFTIRCNLHSQPVFMIGHKISLIQFIE